MENQEVDLAQAMQFVDAKIALAEAMQRLEKNPDFDLLFIKGFVEDWALTQIANVGVYNADQRRGYLEQSIARGTFSQYCYDIVEDGRSAKMARPEIP